LIFGNEVFSKIKDSTFLLIHILQIDKNDDVFR